MMARCLWAILLVVVLSSAGYSGHSFPSIAMFEWQHDGVTEDGFRYGIQRVFPDARFYVYNLAGQERLLDLYLASARERGHDLYYVAGSDLTRKLLNSQHQVPLVFTLVQSPVEEGLIASWASSENNATGVSNRVPILNQLKTLKRIVAFRNLGVLCQQGSRDSAQQVRELERLQSFLGYRLRPICLTPETAAHPIPAEQLTDLDAVYITNSPLLASYGRALIGQLNEAQIPTLTADLEMVRQNGALLGLVPDNYRIGRLAALNAQQILEGADPGSVPSRDLDYFMVVLNMNTARDLQVQVPLSLLIIADTIIR